MQVPVIIFPRTTFYTPVILSKHQYLLRTIARGWYVFSSVFVRFEDCRFTRRIKSLTSLPPLSRGVATSKVADIFVELPDSGASHLADISLSLIKR